MVPMESNPQNFAGKVARRAFLLFIGCALIPISVLTFLAIRQVTDELRDQTVRRLRQSSKAIGLELHRRLLSLESAIGNNDETLKNFDDGLRRQFIGVELVNVDGARRRFSGQPANLPPFSPAQLRHLASGQSVLSTEPGLLRPARFFMGRATHPEHPDGSYL